MQKNGVELSISPEETSSHFTIVPFPSRVRQGLKSACYSGPSHPPILPSNIKRMFRYLGVDRSSALFKFFIQNFGKLGGGRPRVIPLIPRETRNSILENLSLSLLLSLLLSCHHLGDNEKKERSARDVIETKRKCNVLRDRINSVTDSRHSTIQETSISGWIRVVLITCSSHTAVTTSR